MTLGTGALRRNSAAAIPGRRPHPGRDADIDEDSVAPSVSMPSLRRPGTIRLPVITYPLRENLLQLLHLLIRQ